MFPILLLDDAEGDLILAERLLRNCKIMNPILAFRKGEELLAYFAAEFDPPALILTDMMMEPMSGVDVLAALQRRGLTDAIPVVMVSGLADHKVLQNGYQSGARTFIIKPMNQDDILQVLGKLKGLEIHEIEDGYVIARNTVGGSEIKTLEFGT